MQRNEICEKIATDMKIGLLSHPLQYNYGGILQAWALSEVLKRKGHEVEILGLKKQHKFRNYLLLPLAWSKRFVNKVIGRLKDPIFIEIIGPLYIFKQINQFRNKRMSIYPLDSLAMIPTERYDVIIVGSDQVWRKDYIKSLWKTDDVSDAFLYKCYGSVNKFAYAASLGVNHWEFTDSETALIRKALSDYIDISVREYSAVQLLSENTGFSSKCIVDPTMLLTADDYVHLLNISINKSGNAPVVSYILDDNYEKQSIISTVVKHYDAECHELSVKNPYTRKLGVEEWVSELANAKIIITDSFHGCVFSIIFGKPLVFIMNEARGNARFDSLIKRFGIEPNLVSPDNPLDLRKDYSLPGNIKCILDSARNESISFLIRTLDICSDNIKSCEKNEG